MAKLYYFEGRGRAEMIRLTLCACSIEFSEEFFYERKDFLKLVDDGKLMFNQVPLLEIDGKNLIQTNSIVRYLGRKSGLCGKSDDEAVQIDMIYEGGRDFMTPWYPIVFKPEADVLADIKNKTFPKYLPMFEKLASANGTGYFVGDSLTLADLSVLEPLLACVEYFGKEILNDYPAVKKVYETLTSHERIAAYLKGPHRQRKNDEKYCSQVKTVLAW